MSFYGLRRAETLPDTRGILRLRLPALSGRDHLFTARCDLVIPPLSRELPPCSAKRESRKKKKKQQRIEGSLDRAECRRRETEHRDAVVKSVGRLKIIQGSSLRVGRFSRREEPPAISPRPWRPNDPLCFMNRAPLACHPTRLFYSPSRRLGHWNFCIFLTVPSEISVEPTEKFR